MTSHIAVFDLMSLEFGEDPIYVNHNTTVEAHFNPDSVSRDVDFFIEDDGGTGTTISGNTILGGSKPGRVKVGGKDSEFEDMVAYKYLTIKEPTNSLNITVEGVSEDSEETPGVFVMVNDDDDNVDNNVDLQIKYDSMSGDDDLIKAHLSFNLETPVDAAHPLHLSVPYSNLAKLRIWDNPDRNGDPIIKNWGNLKYESASDLPSDIYIEGTYANAFQLIFSYNHLATGEVSDTVVFRAVKTDISLEGLSDEKKIRVDGEVVRVEPYEFSTGDRLQVNSASDSENLVPLNVKVSGLPSSASSWAKLKLEWTDSRIDVYPEQDMGATKLASPYEINYSDLPKTLYVNPKAASAQLRDCEIKATLTTAVTNIVDCEDIIRLTIDDADIDVDSDNDGQLEQENGEEDRIECLEETEHSGKITQVDDGDLDSDGITDNVDFEIKGNGFDENIFAEVRIKLSESIDLDNCGIRISYKSSDPNNLQSEGTKPASGTFRLWKKQSNKLRNPATAKDGGDYIASLSSNDDPYSPTQIFGDGNREAIFYLETVNTPNNTLTSVITLKAFSIDNSQGKFNMLDKVRINPIKLQFVTRGSNDNSVKVTDFVGVSTPRPQLVLNDVSADQVSITGSSARITLSGIVTDPIADNLPEGMGEIQTVTVYVDGEEETSASVTSVPAGDPSFWKQHPWKAQFKNITISLPLDPMDQGTYFIIVESSANKAGVKGFDELEIKFKEDTNGWKVSNVKNLKGSGESETSLLTARVKGLVGAEKYNLKFKNTLFELEARGGWYYFRGTEDDKISTALITEHPDSEDQARIIYYDPVAKALKKKTHNIGNTLETVLVDKNNPNLELPKVGVTVVRVDIDVDSTNHWDDQYFTTDFRNKDVDAIEDFSGRNHPGKILFVNEIDKDGDNVPDYADGWNCPTGQVPGLPWETGSRARNSKEEFAPMILEIRAPKKLEDIILVKFKYPESKPDSMKLKPITHVFKFTRWEKDTNGNNKKDNDEIKEYEKEAIEYRLETEGFLRIWNKEGSEARNSDSDFIESGKEYSLNDLGLKLNKASTLYLEAVAVTKQWGKGLIEVMISFDNGKTWINSDAVRCTCVKSIFTVGVVRQFTF